MENRHEWTDFETLNELTANFERAGGNLFDAGVEITMNQASHFQMLFLKVASLSTIVRNYCELFRKRVTPFVIMRIETTSKGSLEVFFKPIVRETYSHRSCDFDRGCCLATARLKHLRDASVTEIACAARSDAPECHYHIAWRPDPHFLVKIRDFFLFRLNSQKVILGYMEESHARLQSQYDEVKKLNEQLQVTIKEKGTLSQELQRLNVELEKKVEEQTADIRAKNLALQESNRKLIGAERMKDLLTGTLVHDIKNFNASMYLNAIAIQKDTPPGEKNSNRASDIAECGKGVASLAANLLDIGKMEEGALTVRKEALTMRDISAIAQKCANNALFEEKGISVVSGESLESAVVVMADRYLISRVFQNLYDNAAAYVPPRGNVKLTATSGENEIVFCLYSSGIPVPEKNKLAIFGKYARLDAVDAEYSKGLGLFFCTMVMDAHGGRIWLDTDETGNYFKLAFKLQQG